MTSGPDRDRADDDRPPDLRNQLWNAMAARSAAELHELARDFYADLLVNVPSLQRHFEGLSLEDQARKLAAALQVLIRFANDPQAMGHEVIRLGMAHRNRGIGLPEYEAFAAMLADVLARQQTLLPVPHARRVWIRELATIVDAMMIVNE